MGNNFFAYLQQLELMTFFSGYTLLYALVFAFTPNKETGNNFKNRMVSVLPLSYALVSTLYLGLQLKNIYAAYSSGQIKLVIHHPYLMSWALPAILFWFPVFRKKEGLSLFHNIVFFFILVKDIFMQIGSSVDEHILKNDMKVYTISLLLNLAAFILTAFFYFFLAQKRRFTYK